MNESIVGKKFGCNGKAATAQRRSYNVIFDDDKRVIADAENRKLQGYLIGGRQGHATLKLALKDFEVNFAAGA